MIDFFRALRLFCSGTSLSIVLGVLICNCDWLLTHMLLAKGFALTNLLAFAGLFVQRKGYERILGRTSLDESAKLERLFRLSFFACVCLFFGIAETPSAAFLSYSFQKIARAFRPFTGLQMFSQLPEATAVFALGSAVAPFSLLPLIVLQQWFVLRLMLGGGLGKFSARCASHVCSGQADDSINQS